MDDILAVLKAGNENLTRTIMRQKYKESAVKGDIVAMRSVPFDMVNNGTMKGVYRTALLDRRYKVALAVPLRCHVLANREEGLECIYDALLEFRELKVFYNRLGKDVHPELKNCGRYYNEKNAVFDYYFLKFFRSIFNSADIKNGLAVNKHLDEMCGMLRSEAFLVKLDSFLGKNAPEPGIMRVFFGIGYEEMTRKLLDFKGIGFIDSSRESAVKTIAGFGHAYAVSARREFPRSACIMR